MKLLLLPLEDAAIAKVENCVRFPLVCLSDAMLKYATGELGSNFSAVKRQFSQFIFGTPQREEPIDVEMLPDYLVLDWGMWFWKAHKEISWRELTIVSAASVLLGDDPGWDCAGIALRWDTPTELHKGRKRIWLPCKPDSSFYAEVQRRIADSRPAPGS